MDKIALSDTPAKRSSLSIDAINSNIASTPAIYVESLNPLKIDGSLITINGQEYKLENMTVLDVVVAIRNSGANAWVTSPAVTMMPAIMLADFSNTNTMVSKINASPYNLLLDKKPYLESLISIDDIYYSVLKMYSADREDIAFSTVSGKVYSDIDESTKIMYTLTYGKYLMRIQNGKAINGKNILDNTVGLKSIYINETNKNDNK